MELLPQILPIIIYLLLIILIVVVIILGIKLILTIDKVNSLVDDVTDKVEKVTPIFNTLGVVSNKFSDIMGTVVGAIEKLISKVFLKNKDKDEMESGEDE